MNQANILIVDDHPIIREGLSQFINSEPDLKVSAAASDATEAMSLIAASPPDLVVTDLSLAGRPGLDLVKELTAKHPAIPVLVLSIHDENIWAERVLRAGAEGYIMKSQATSQIVAAIRRVLGGGIWVGEHLNELLLQKQIRRHKLRDGSPLDQLSDREVEVFHCIGQGLSVKEIAAAFQLSSKTVEVHRDHIREKLRMKSAADLLRYAVTYLLAET